MNYVVHYIFSLVYIHCFLVQTKLIKSQKFTTFLAHHHKAFYKNSPSTWLTNKYSIRRGNYIEWSDLHSILYKRGKLRSFSLCACVILGTIRYTLFHYKNLFLSFCSKSRSINFQFPQKQGTGIRKLLPHVSTECIELIELMCTYDPDER